MSFSRYMCWQPDRLGQVIAKAALDIDRATFMATHMPMEEIAYEISPIAILNTSEKDFLAEINRMNYEDLHTFAVIKGIPGTGKSHLIRWLYENYKDTYPDDVVILIERANTSLKNTIEQIITSGVFASPVFVEELKQLRGASDALSMKGLEDTLLNHLQVGVMEMESKWHESLHRRIAPEKLSNFLLDLNIRDHFKKDNGPVKRVVRYMQEGRGLGEDEIPEFDAAELIFDAQQRIQIKNGGYQDAQDVADDISRTTTDKHRIQLARYLNFVLRNYAISKTTNLTAADLREMFNELRRDLRNAGKKLSLFIEDITAFTGIDAGLIDVLITEHRGERNKEFCQLTSVVGITDAYFRDNFPLNVQQRISHLLTLNSKSGDNAASDFLENDSVLVEFVARYLNAIRIKAQSLTDWEKKGASLSHLPNACVDCQYRIRCHAAFGNARKTDSELSTASEIGLYPFNKTSLIRMYRSLQDNVARTPRSLLNEIVSYILQSHGNKVASGNFPPNENKLAPQIKALEFEPRAHRSIVEQQGGDDTDRLITLLLYWGNRSVYSEKDNQLIGGLPAEVYEAFDLPLIQGRPATTTSTPVPPQPVPPKVSPDDLKPPLSKPKTVQENPLILYIADWDRGKPLYGHNELLGWMANLFINSIDWQQYDIPPNHVPSQGQASSYFAIEGQSAQILGKRLVFKKSSQLRDALYALVFFNTKDISRSAEEYGENLTKLHLWLDQGEKNIVRFLKDKAETQEIGSTTYSSLLLENAVLLACLSNALSPKMTLLDMYSAVSKSCVGQENEHKEKWQELIERFPHGPWRTLMKKLQSDVGIVREETLQQLNSVQGEGTQVQFLKAAKLFNVIKNLEEREWTFADLDIVPPDGIGQRHWESALRVRKTLKEEFFEVITETYALLTQKNDEINTYLGDADPNEVISEMQKLAQELQSKHPINHSLQIKIFNAYNPDELIQYQNEFYKINSQQTITEIARSLSSRGLEIEKQLDTYCSFLREFHLEIEKVLSYLEQQTIKDTATKQISNYIEEISSKYNTTLKQIEKLLNEV